MVRSGYLLAQFVLYMLLDTPQHERFEDHVQPTELVFVEFVAFVLRGILDVLRKPLVELVVGVEETWHDEMQQSPKFCAEVLIRV